MLTLPCSHLQWLLLFLCQPLKKGPYCFAPVGGRSADKAMCAQFLLTPLLKSYQTWHSGCPLGVNDLYRF